MAQNNKHPVIVFIGQPNSGKSTLFNSIAGFKAETSNFPGTTVKHTHSKVNFKNKIFNIIDLPGTYSLNPSDPAEKVALTHLFSEKPDIVINVLDASSLGRHLALTLELIELGYPMVVALNMVDLAEKKGIKTDPKKLEKMLGVSVVSTVAKHGRGVKDLIKSVFECLETKSCVRSLKWSKDVEEKIDEFIKKLPEDFPVVSNSRFTAVKMIEADKLLFNEVLEKINPSLKSILDKVRDDLERTHNAPAYEVIAAERHHLAMKIFEESSKIKRGKIKNWEEIVDDVIMHPFYGYLILMAVLVGFFFFIFKIGSPTEELLLGPLESIREYLSVHLGDGLVYFVVDSLLQGIGGGVAIVLPFFIPLIFIMSFLEDIGYLARAGFLMDTFMHKIGLHGKSVSPFILGFGCNVPAIVSTRILESRRDRVITSLLIPFIPCSARTTIILALIAFYLGPLWALGFYLFNIILVGIIGRIITYFYKTPSPGLILEIPSLKLPSLNNIWKKTFLQLKSFIYFAWPLLIVGSVILGIMQLLNLDEVINNILSPLVTTVLGLPENLGVTLIFGFLRKELSLIMMLQSLEVSYPELMTVVSKEQIIVFTVFVSFFIPCLSTVAIIWKEIGRKVALVSMGLNVTVAIIVSFIVRLII